MVTTLDSSREGSATAQQEAYDHVREMIMSGDLKPGERINLAEVAKALAISRMPVRDALRQLDAEGLVSLRPNRGARVVSLAPIEVEELYLIRAALEPLAVKLAVPRITRDEIDQLALIKEQMDRASGNRSVWLARHRQFHDALYRLSGRAHLTRQITRVTDLLAPYLAAHISHHNRSDRGVFRHIQCCVHGDWRAGIVVLFFKELARPAR